MAAKKLTSKTKKKLSPNQEGALKSIKSVASVPSGKESYICPIIKIAGEKHALEKLSESGAEPEMKAVGYFNLNPGKQHQWVSYVVTFKGDKVLKIEITEPDMRKIAEETAKENFVFELMDQDLV